MIYFFLFIFIIFFIIKSYNLIKSIDSKSNFQNTYEGFNDPLESNYYNQTCNMFDDKYKFSNGFVPYNEFKCNNMDYNREKQEYKKKKIEFNNCQRPWMVCDI